MLSEAQLNRRGLLKLMLRRPELRSRLQFLGASNEYLLSLCGAFEDATATLEEIRSEGTKENTLAIAEYEELCREIEKEIEEFCTR